MPKEHSSQGSENDEPLGDAKITVIAGPTTALGPMMTRRHFVSAAGLAALGLAAGCTQMSGTGASVRVKSASEASSAASATSTAPIGPGWLPLSSLATVSVATDAAATKYPALNDAAAFDQHPAVALLQRALGGLSDATPVEFLRTLVPAGGTVLIKPNWVEPASWEKAKITHPSLVVAMARLAAEAVGPQGRVVIAEGTSEGPDLPKVLAATGFRKALTTLTAASSKAASAPIEIVDLNAASAGRLTVALGGLSRFASRHEVMYDPHGKPMGKMGDGRVGTYLLSKPIIKADLIVDMAKAKVHCSAGATLALKNFVGIVPSDDGPYGDNSMKDIPHYSQVDVDAGTKYVGNRTIGNSAADLQAAAAYVARDGSLQRTRQRKLLCVIDGIVSGQSSQFTPDPVGTGFVVAGVDPVAVDHVAARCMGFDPPLVRSFQPSATGTLSLGTADPSKTRIVYDGTGSFSAYFSARKQLEPESVQAKWGDTMTLRTFDAGAPQVAIGGGRLTAAVRAGAGAVRLEAGGQFAALSPSGGGTFQIAWPPRGVAQARLVVLDKHFNLAEKTLTA